MRSLLFEHSTLIYTGASPAVVRGDDYYVQASLPMKRKHEGTYVCIIISMALQIISNKLKVLSKPYTFPSVYTYSCIPQDFVNWIVWGIYTNAWL